MDPEIFTIMSFDWLDNGLWWDNFMSSSPILYNQNLFM